MRRKPAQPARIASLAWISESYSLSASTFCCGSRRRICAVASMPLVPGSVQVHQHQVGLQLEGLDHRLAPVDGLVDDAVVGMGGEQRPQAVAQQRVVFGNEDAVAHGVAADEVTVEGLARGGTGDAGVALARGTNMKRHDAYCVAPSKASRPGAKVVRRSGSPSAWL